MSRYYKYVVDYQDEIENSRKTEGGIVCADDDTYLAATTALVDYYGDRNINAIKLLEATVYDHSVITVAEVHDLIIS